MAAADPSRGKNASVEAAPAKNSTAIAIASGLAANRRRSVTARRGKVVLGIGVAAPDTRKRPITAAYVTRHRMHTAFTIANEAYPRYSTTASARVESTKR